MTKIIRSLYHFYLSHFFVGICVSLSSMYLYHKFGNHAVPALCWFKGITMIIFLYAINRQKRMQFYYYQNLGISKRLLLGVTFGIDFIFFIVLMCLADYIL